MRRVSQKRYIQVFLLTVLLLAIFREFRPSVVESAPVEAAPQDSLVDEVRIDDLLEIAEDEFLTPVEEVVSDVERDIMGKESVVAFDKNLAVRIDTTDAFRPHRVVGVSSFDKAFPDSNHVQIADAQRWGIPQLMAKADLEREKKKLVYIGWNPYYSVDSLTHSVPYLVPRAAVLLQDIGQNFFDSLQVKQIPLHRIIVTSVLRSKESVAQLSRQNGNASPNSCHQYATTFDITYNRFQPVLSAYGTPPEVSFVTLKQVLSEVLDDLRLSDRCWVKYERKQACFHVTVR